MIGKYPNTVKQPVIKEIFSAVVDLQFDIIVPTKKGNITEATAVEDESLRRLKLRNGCYYGTKYLKL